MLSEKISTKANILDRYIQYDCSSLLSIISEAEKVGRAWSGSFLGYHSLVYYNNFFIPPPGANFSSEWGLYSGYDMVGLGSNGEWAEYSFDSVIQYIQEKSGNPDLEEYSKASHEAREDIEDIKASALSAIHSQKKLENDVYLTKLITEFEKIKPLTARDFRKAYLPRGSIATRDQHVEHKILMPPHLVLICSAYELLSPFNTAKDLKKTLIKISDYLNNLEYKMDKESRIGTNIFIGHGRSHDWRDLKDFIRDRLNLPWDEFNRVPVAGLTNVTRLAQMLDQSAIAFLVMTAEDEQSDGSLHARMNVIHEVGLFQGRLGFERAIVLLEDGCTEFSNIHGLGQIRYPKSNISAIFEDIRQILERENLL